MKKPTSTAAKVRDMIHRGYNNKTIIDKLGVKPQIVYNTRYQMNKERGLGAIGKPAPAPREGIGAPPKRKYTRKVKAGELASLPPTPPVVHPNAPVHPAMTEPLVRVEPYTITMIEPEPSLWDRIKERTKNIFRAFA